MGDTQTVILDFYFNNNLAPPNFRMSLVDQFLNDDEQLWNTMLNEINTQQLKQQSILNQIQILQDKIYIGQNVSIKFTKEKERLLLYIDNQDKKLIKRQQNFLKLQDFLSLNSHYQDESILLDKNIKHLQTLIQQLDLKSDFMNKETDRCMKDQELHIEKRKQFLDHLNQIIEEQTILEDTNNKSKKESERLLLIVQNMVAFAQKDKIQQEIQENIFGNNMSCSQELQGQSLLCSVLNRQSELKKMKKIIHKQNSTKQKKQIFIEKFNFIEQEKQIQQDLNSSKIHCHSAKPNLFSTKPLGQQKNYYSPEIAYYKELSVSPFTVQNQSQYIEYNSDKNLGKLRIMRTMDYTSSGKEQYKRISLQDNNEKTLKEELGQINKSFDLGKLEQIKEELFVNSNGEPTFRENMSRSEKFEFPVQKSKSKSLERPLCILAIFAFLILSK